MRSATLRVDFAKLDLLMNLVGELVLGKQRVHTNLQGLTALSRELETQRRLARRTAQPGGADAADRRGLLKELAEEIGRVEGVDGLFIGPSDLAASLGHLGNNAHPEVRALITDACRRARAIGTPIGILAPVEADARAYLEMGFQYVAVGSDIGVLKNATDALRSKFK